MKHSRHLLLITLLATALALTGAASVLTHSHNSSTLPSGFNVSNDAESTALYCTGLGGSRGPLAGHVVFLNTTGTARTLSVQVVSEAGRQTTTNLHLPAHGRQSLAPDKLVKGSAFAVAAQVDGGGVVAQELTSGPSAVAACTSSAVTNWFGTGFDTRVGSSAALNIYNPTATPAVLNVTCFTPTGFSAPASFQGLSVGPHRDVSLNLAPQIVDTANFGVEVSVVRGSIEVVGDQTSGAVASLNVGSTRASTSSWFPLVTTARGAVAQVRVANPSQKRANVTLKVSLGHYLIAPQSVTVAAHSSASFTITPNSAIPAAGDATVALTSTVAVVAALATGTDRGVALSAAQSPSSEFLVADVTGQGFKSGTVTNSSSRTITVRFTTLNGASLPVTTSVELPAHSTRALTRLEPWTSTRSQRMLFVDTSKPSLIVTGTLPSSPAGVTVVAALNGR